MENRELGESPKRTHHCKTEQMHMPLSYREGAHAKKSSQETCL